jgi:hypothetical protein
MLMVKAGKKDTVRSYQSLGFFSGAFSGKMGVGHISRPTSDEP